MLRAADSLPTWWRRAFARLFHVRLLRYVSLALQQLPIAIFCVSRTEVIRFAAGRALTRADYDPAQLHGLTLTETIPDSAAVLAGYRQAFTGVESDLLHIASTGDLYWTVFIPVRDNRYVAAVAATINLTSVSRLPTGATDALDRLRNGASATDAHPEAPRTYGP